MNLSVLKWIEICTYLVPFERIDFLIFWINEKHVAQNERNSCLLLRIMVIFKKKMGWGMQNQVNCSILGKLNKYITHARERSWWESSGAALAAWMQRRLLLVNTGTRDWRPPRSGQSPVQTTGLLSNAWVMYSWSEGRAEYHSFSIHGTPVKCHRSAVLIAHSTRHDQFEVVSQNKKIGKYNSNHTCNAWYDYAVLEKGYGFQDCLSGVVTCLVSSCALICKGSHTARDRPH